MLYALGFRLLEYLIVGWSGALECNLMRRLVHEIGLYPIHAD